MVIALLWLGLTSSAGAATEPVPKEASSPWDLHTVVLPPLRRDRLAVQAPLIPPLLAEGLEPAAAPEATDAPLPLPELGRRSRLSVPLLTEAGMPLPTRPLGGGRGRTDTGTREHPGLPLGVQVALGVLAGAGALTLSGAIVAATGPATY